MEEGGEEGEEMNGNETKLFNSSVSPQNKLESIIIFKLSLN